MADTKPRPGLYQKFNVARIHGEDKPGEQFFVLSPTHDPLARKVLRAYAVECRASGLEDLAADLFEAIDRAEIGGLFYPEVTDESTQSN